MPPDPDPSPTVAGLIRTRSGDPSPGLRFEGRVWTWAEVVGEMEARAAFLVDLVPDEPPHIGPPHIEPPHVGVLLDNVPEFLFTIGGAALSGRVVVGVNPTRRGEELARDIRHADCRAIITDAEHAALLDGLDLGAANGRVHVVDDDSYAATLAQHRERPAGATATPSADDLLMLIFTSGSTGAPKAVRMTQGRAARSASSPMGFGPDDVLYCAMPVFHGNALMSMVFPSFAVGSCLVFRRRFSATGFLPDIREHGCTFTSTIGRALSYVLATPESDHDRDHRLKFVLAPESSTADLIAFKRRFGVPAFGGYGSSENAIVMIPAPGQPREALGSPAPGLDVAVIDPATATECARARFDGDGRLLNADEAIGELVGRNAGERFEGYYNNDAANAERTRNGWYWSGDLAYRDEQDVFYFAGRNADWLRVDGENFAAAPVERVLQRFDAIAGVAVFGVPDDRTIDDQVMAVLELADGATFDPAAFDAFLADQRDLGTKWSPRYVRITATLPVTATNKIDKAPLRRAGWADTDGDEVYWRPERRDPLRPLSDDDRRELVGRFEANGRAEALRR